ncbi:MAG: SPASM domain-containing protein, partial [bacterium]
KENYFNVKKLSLPKTVDHLTYFLSKRRELHAHVPLTIQVITLHDYLHSIYKYYKFYPKKLNNKDLLKIPDDFFIIRNQYKKLLDPAKDRILKSLIIGWAERSQVNPHTINYSQYTCPQLERMEKDIFIRSDGAYYICCYDAYGEIILGNISRQSIHEIYVSDRRKQLITLLKNKEFSKIGGPCTTVNCCYQIRKSRFDLGIAYIKHIFNLCAGRY